MHDAITYVFHNKKIVWSYMISIDIHALSSQQYFLNFSPYFSLRRDYNHHLGTRSPKVVSFK